MSVARTKAEKVHKIFMVKICKEIFADGEICQKMKHYSFYSVISAIWDRSKYSNLIRMYYYAEGGLFSHEYFLH